jgi:sugar O-acyltransferase (sialic acid O-acetyltransferase NeuD family)
VQRVVILGAGGFAREVLDIFDAINAVGERFDVLGFVVDRSFGQAGTPVNDRKILGDFGWFDAHPDVQAICGVGAPEVRMRMVRQAEARGVGFCSAIHPNAVLTRHVRVGAGVVIGAGCVLTNQIELEPHVHLNLDCTVGHDVLMEDFATTAPGVHISGGVVFEQGAFVGTGANIIEQVRIGAWSIVGAGATVIRDVPGNATAVGQPARVIATREPGWHLA